MSDQSQESVTPQDPGPHPLLFTKSRWYQILIIGIVQLVLTAIAVSVAITVDRRSNRALCGIIVMSDESLKARPPQDEQGRRYAAEMSRLRRKLGC